MKRKYVAFHSIKDMASQKTSHPSFFSLQFDFLRHFSVYICIFHLMYQVAGKLFSNYTLYNCQFKGIVLSAILPKQGVSYSIVSAN